MLHHNTMVILGSIVFKQLQKLKASFKEVHTRWCFCVKFGWIYPYLTKPQIKCSEFFIRLVTIWKLHKNLKSFAFATHFPCNCNFRLQNFNDNSNFT